jgi:hypothetical protein
LILIDLSMKNRLLVAVVFCLTFVGFHAQQTNRVAFATSKTELAEGKRIGKFKFVLPDGLSLDDVKKNASYYVHNFSVEYVPNKNEAFITMVTNDERNRLIIVRFLSACGVQQVNIEGTLMETFKFYETYLK